MNLTRESRRSAEDVFLVGEELPADDADDADAEGGFFVQGTTPEERAGPDAFETRPEVDERSPRRAGSRRLVGAMALGLGLIALAVVVLRPDGGGKPTSQPEQPTAARLVDGQGGDDRQQSVRARQRAREERAQERRNSAKPDRAERRPRRSGSGSEDSAAVAASAPAPTATTAYTPPATTTSTQAAPSTSSGTDTATAGGGSGGSGSNDPAPCEFTFEC